MENNQRRDSVTRTAEVALAMQKAMVTVLGKLDKDSKASVLGTASRNDGITVAVLLANEQEGEFVKQLRAANKTNKLRSLLSDVILLCGLRPDDLYMYYFEPLLSSSTILAGEYKTDTVRELFDEIIKSYPELLMVMMLEQQDFQLTDKR